MKIQKFNPSSTDVNREFLGEKTWVNDKLLYDAQLRVIDHTKKLFYHYTHPYVILTCIHFFISEEQKILYFE